MTKYLRTALATLLLVALMATPVIAKSVTVEKATATAQKLFNDYPFEVISVKESPLKGLWEAGLVLEGRHRVLYFDPSGEFVIFPGKETLGQLIDLKSMKSLTNESTMKLGKIDFKTLPLKDSIVMGDPKAAIQVAVFDDPY